MQRRKFLAVLLCLSLIIPLFTFTYIVSSQTSIDSSEITTIIEQQLSEPWYIKSPYPDYAPSGMPDFDERQDKWYWRSWAFPDAIAVWQHNQTVEGGGQHGTWDWDIYYSIYTDPNVWWTLGCQTARPLVADSLSPGPAAFLPGDDLQPAISWYSSNYSIVVWQHFNYTENDWDIWYSLFTPNIGWTWPAAVAQIPGADEDPAIAFDNTSGWAVCVWVHTNPDNTRVIYYSLWNPDTLSWVGPAIAIGVCFGNAWMPEVDIDSKHNVLVVWTDGNLTREVVWYSWAPAPPPGPPLAWSAPASILGCPLGINWHKGLSPDNLGNNLLDFSYPFPRVGGEPIHYAQFTSPEKNWTIPPSNLTNPSTNGEHPDLAFDLNSNSITVYTQWPTGQIYFSFWNGTNWAPIGGTFATTAATGTLDQEPALAFIANNKAVLVWDSALNTTTPGGPLSYDSDVFFSVYTPPYPPGAWTRAAFIVPGGVNNPNGGSIPSLPGDDYSIRIASPTGSPTTPPSTPPSPPSPANPSWSWCGPVAVANSLWWLDSKFEPNNIPPPTISDGFLLVKSYNPGVWDDHDPQNVQPLIQHLAWLMDTDGQRTKTCHCGTNVWDMQAGITQYLSWSGVNPLGDVNGDGVVNQTDVNIVNAAMGSTPGAPNWNLAADIWPETLTGPRTADNVVNASDLNLVQQNLGKRGMFYEHTTETCPDFYYIEEEVEKSQDVIILLGFYHNGIRDGGHFVTVAGVNSTTQQLLISNPIRDDFEAGKTPGRSPVPHPYPHNFTVHNNASLVSQDAYTALYNLETGCWFLDGYFDDPSWEARIEYAVITSPYIGIHDLAVTSITSTKTVICQGFTGNISVTILNQGNYTETFNVTLYANMTIIQTKTITLTNESSITVTFTWNTAGFAKGNYTISAYAWPVPEETNTANNNLTDSWVIVSIVGDITGPNGYPDGIVDMRDVGTVARAFGSYPSRPRWNPNADINNDGKIDMKDVGRTARNFGKTDP